jgi:archaemetzincin
MSEITLVPLHFQKSFLLDFLKTNIPGITGISTAIQNHNINLDPFFDSNRGQYDASKIIQAFEKENSSLSIICTTVDLFIPIFTFVFGLAKLGGDVGIVSSHRLENQFYGLPDNEELLSQRLLKEVIHEFGHLMGLRHCPHFDCVMASSTSADDVDIKKPIYCSTCQTTFEKNLPQKSLE